MFSGNHWRLLVVFKKKKCILVLDSLQNFPSEDNEDEKKALYDKGITQEQMYHFLNEAEVAMGNEAFWNADNTPYFFHSKTPQQGDKENENYNDCGIYVMYFFEKILECCDAKPNFRKPNRHPEFMDDFLKLTQNHKKQIPRKRKEIYVAMKNVLDGTKKPPKSPSSFQEQGSSPDKQLQPSFIDPLTIDFIMKYPLVLDFQDINHQLISAALCICDWDFEETLALLMNPEKHPFAQALRDANCQQILDQKNAIMKKWIAHQGKKVIPVLSDGNCLFRVIAYHVYGDAEKYAKIRKEVVQEMKSHKMSYTLLFIELRQNDPSHPDGHWSNFDAYLNYMSQDQSWGNSLEIKAISKLYKRKIVYYCDHYVATNDHDMDSLPCVTVFPLRATYQESFEMTFEGGNHFQIVIPSGKQDAHVPAPQKRTLFAPILPEKLHESDDVVLDTYLKSVAPTWKRLPRKSNLQKATVQHFSNRNFLYCVCFNTKRGDLDGNCLYNAISYGRNMTTVLSWTDNKTRRKFLDAEVSGYRNKVADYLTRGSFDKELTEQTIIINENNKNRAPRVNRSSRVEDPIDWTLLISQIRNGHYYGDALSVSALANELNLGFFIWNEFESALSALDFNPSKHSQFMILNWEKENHYNLIGYYDEQNNNVTTLFDINTHVGFQVYNHLQPKQVVQENKQKELLSAYPKIKSPELERIMNTTKDQKEIQKQCQFISLLRQELEKIDLGDIDYEDCRLCYGASSSWNVDTILDVVEKHRKVKKGQKTLHDKTKKLHSYQEVFNRLKALDWNEMFLELD